MLPVDIMRTKPDIRACRQWSVITLVEIAMPIQSNCILYPNQYNQPVKPVRFLGDSLKCLRQFPEDAKQDAGYQLDKVQKGKQPDDFKPMPSIGTGVEEIRIRDASGIYRVIYTARLTDAAYVLHAFQKKTQATARHDIDIARERLAQLMRGNK